ncbi:MAG: MlaD family protein [Stellaceae bacterium]
MSDSDPSGPAPDNPPTPAASSWAGLPWVWAVPVVAAIIAGWLGYRALIERGPTITIGFVTADGVEPERTTIRYKNVELGRVTGIGLTPDGSRVVVTAEMRREAEPLLRADSEFWVVQPRITPSGITGLTTIVSGAYIGMLPGKGAPGARSFTGLETPPPKDGLVSGREFTLIADRLPSISDQSPVYYHGVQVGEVTGHELSDRDGSVSVRIFVYDPHETLIRAASLRAEARIRPERGHDPHPGHDRDRAGSDRHAGRTLAAEADRGDQPDLRAARHRRPARPDSRRQPAAGTASD